MTQRCACCGKPFEPRPQVPDQAYWSASDCPRAGLLVPLTISRTDLFSRCRIRKPARDDHAHAAAASLLADVLDGDRCWVEHDAIVRRDGGDLAEDLRNRFQLACAEARQVGVARGPPV